MKTEEISQLSVSIVWFTDLTVDAFTTCWSSRVWDTLRNSVTASMEPIVPTRTSVRSDIFFPFILFSPPTRLRQVDES